MDNTDELLEKLLKKHPKLGKKEIVTHSDCCDYVADHTYDLDDVQDFLQYYDDKYEYHLLDVVYRPDDRNRKERVIALVVEFDEEEQQ